ncbi:MAG: cytochrome c oxidase subunit II [Bacteroidetes bacterium]|nr:cytochrome c oxidase subunit II [Bacteroidota bacterium]
MIKLLVYVAIVLLIITIAQLVRVFELAAELKGSKNNEVTYKDHRNQGRMMFGFLFLFMAFCLWQCVKYKDSILPESASVHGVDLDWLMWFNMSFIGIVFVILNILLFYFTYKYYSRPDQQATYYPHNNKLELIWTIVPAAALAVIIILGIKMWNTITEPAANDAIIIELYAKQFDWSARYAGKDNQLGHSSYKNIGGANALGMDTLDAKGMDDIIVRNELHIPLGKQVEFKINSRDVIHSAFMPHFRIQMNAVPGMVTSMHMTPSITTEEMRKRPEVIDQMKRINNLRAKNGLDPYEFNYILLCNKICGASHYNMQMNVVVDTPDQYEIWLAKQKPFLAKN